MEKETNKKKTNTSTGAKKSTTKSATSSKSTVKKVATKKNGPSATKKTASNGPKKTTQKTQASKKKNDVKVVSKKEKEVQMVVPVEEKKIESKKEQKKNPVIKDKEIIKPETKKENFMLEKNELTNLLKIVLIITAIFLAVYLITYIIDKNSNDKGTETDSTSASIQYDEILLSNLLKQNNSEYYVLAYDAEDKYFDAYSIYMTTYTSKENALRVYTSIISNSFNKAYYDKEAESNTNISNISDLRVNTSTLFRVRDGKVIESYQGNAAIIAQLKNLIS